MLRQCPNTSAYLDPTSTSYVSFLNLILIKNSLLNHADLLPPLFDLPIMGIIMGIISKPVGGGPPKSPSTPAPLFSPELYPMGLSKQFPEQVLGCSLEVQGWEFYLCCFFPSRSWTPAFCDSCCQRCSNLHMPNKVSLVCKREVQQSKSPCWLCDYLFQEIIINTF